MRRSAKWFVLACLLGAQVTACTATHVSPQEGTETGNPPIINQDLVALVVSANDVRIVGKAGAVTPGGSTVQVISSLTGMTFEARSNADGSFDVALAASPSDTFELRALLGSAQSSVVYVVRGGAAVGQGSGQTLSCKQREALATAQMTALVASAGSRCLIDTDCTTAGQATACSESCSTAVVSKVDALQIEEARAALEEGLCASFAADGCSVLRLPCPPPPLSVRCVQERCVEAQPVQDADCSSDFEAGSGFAANPVYWYYPQGHVCLPRIYGGVAGNGNRYASRVQCESSCLKPDSFCPPNRIASEVCVQGGLAGGCAETALACALACASGEQCAGDPIGGWCHGNVCDAFSPL